MSLYTFLYLRIVVCKTQMYQIKFQILMLMSFHPKVSEIIIFKIIHSSLQSIKRVFKETENGVTDAQRVLNPFISKKRRFAQKFSYIISKYSLSQVLTCI